MANHWWPAPDAGDIVWCRFPEDKSLEPGPKPRPALVVRVFDDHAPRFFVQVIYGTSQKTDQLRSGEFLITRQEAAAFRLSGLSYPTKFNARNSIELPYNDDWFRPPPKAPHGPIPKLGVLHPSFLPRVRAAFEAASR